MRLPHTIVRSIARSCAHSMVLFLMPLALLGCDKQPTRVTIKSKPDGLLTKKGASLDLRASTYGADGIVLATREPITWTSSDPLVATVDKDGRVTAVGSGEAKVAARFGALSDEVSVNVRIVQEIQLGFAAPVPLKMGKTLQLEPKLIDDKGQPYLGATPKLRYSSSTHCVDVDQTGLVTAQALGECEVFVAVGDRVGSMRVIVKD